MTKAAILALLDEGDALIVVDHPEPDPRSGGLFRRRTVRAMFEGLPDQGLVRRDIVARLIGSGAVVRCAARDEAAGQIGRVYSTPAGVAARERRAPAARRAERGRSAHDGSMLPPPLSVASLDPDYRKDPGTDRFCLLCQRDLKPAADPARVRVSTVAGDSALVAPADPRPAETYYVGPECRRKVPTEYLLAADDPRRPEDEPYAAAMRARFARAATERERRFGSLSRRG